MKTTENKYTGRLYWGETPLPQEAELIGTVTRDNGETGALIKLSNGNMVQGNAGTIKSLPKMEDKVKSSYYLPRDMDKEMRVRAAELGLGYPSEFIEMLWEFYQNNSNT